MRKLASIRLVGTVEPVQGADRLEQVSIDGWRVVTRKGDFIPGDKVVYFEIDSALPADDDRYKFLHERCLKRWMNHGALIKEVVRIKSIKLRGVISQGLIMSLQEFPELADKEVGYDATELLGVQHYDELAEYCGRIQGKAHLAGDQAGSFPTYLVPKTDEERLQNLPEYFDGRYNDVMWEVTEKFDGCSATYIWAPVERPENPFFVCSRNFELKDTEGNLYWDIAKKYGIRDKLKRVCDYAKFGYEWARTTQVAIQGEIVGPGVNGNRDQYTDYAFYVFRAYDITHNRWIHPEACRLFVTNELGLDYVKVISGRFDAFGELRSMDDFLNFVDGDTDRGHPREGMVFKTFVGDGLVSFKVINNNYLLKQRD